MNEKSDKKKKGQTNGSSFSSSEEKKQKKDSSKKRNQTNASTEKMEQSQEQGTGRITVSKLRGAIGNAENGTDSEANHLPSKNFEDNILSLLKGLTSFNNGNQNNRSSEPDTNQTSIQIKANMENVENSRDENVPKEVIIIITNPNLKKSEEVQYRTEATKSEIKTEETTKKLTTNPHSWKQDVIAIDPNTGESSNATKSAQHSTSRSQVNSETMTQEELNSISTNARRVHRRSPSPSKRYGMRYKTHDPINSRTNYISTYTVRSRPMSLSPPRHNEMHFNMHDERHNKIHYPVCGGSTYISQHIRRSRSKSSDPPTDSEIQCPMHDEEMFLELNTTTGIRSRRTGPKTPSPPPSQFNKMHDPATREKQYQMQQMHYPMNDQRPDESFNHMGDQMHYQINEQTHKLPYFQINEQTHEKTNYQMNDQPHKEAYYQINDQPHEEAYYQMNDQPNEEAHCQINDLPHKEAYYQMNSLTPREMYYQMNDQMHDKNLCRSQTPPPSFKSELLKDLTVRQHYHPRHRSRSRSWNDARSPTQTHCQGNSQAPTRSFRERSRSLSSSRHEISRSKSRPRGKISRSQSRQRHERFQSQSKRSRSRSRSQNERFLSKCHSQTERSRSRSRSQNKRFPSRFHSQPKRSRSQSPFRLEKSQSQRRRSRSQSRPRDKISRSRRATRTNSDSESKHFIKDFIDLSKSESKSKSKSNSPSKTIKKSKYEIKFEDRNSKRNSENRSRLPFVTKPKGRSPRARQEFKRKMVSFERKLSPTRIPKNKKNNKEKKITQKLAPKGDKIESLPEEPQIIQYLQVHQDPYFSRPPMFYPPRAMVMPPPMRSRMRPMMGPPIRLLPRPPPAPYFMGPQPPFMGYPPHPRPFYRPP